MLRRKVRPFLCRFVVASSIMWGVAASMACAQKIDAGDVPLISSETAEELTSGTNGLWLYETAENALSGGFSDIAASFYLKALATEELDQRTTNRARLKLLTAYINDGSLNAAETLLSEFENQDEPKLLLRRAMLLFRKEQNLSSIADKLRKINLSDVYPEEQAWLYFVWGLLDERRGNMEARDRNFALAREKAVGDAEKAQIAANIFRSSVYLSEGSEERAVALKKQLDERQGQRVSLSFARAYAVELYKLGRTEEAIRTVEEHLNRLPVQESSARHEFRLLLGLLAGPDSPKGRAELERLLADTAPREDLKVALYLLTAAADSAPEKDNLILLLDRLLSGPTPHILEDELLYQRALLSLDQNEQEAADGFAARLLEIYPGSPLRDKAIKVRAFSAWSRGQYLTAADYLNRLKDGLPAGHARARVTQLIADSYYRTANYESAADAYLSALSETTEANTRGVLLFQAVSANLEAGRLSRAREILDNPTHVSTVRPDYRWMAEWNFMNVLKQRNSPLEAFDRVRSILGGGRSMPPLSPVLRLRMMWLEAQLSREVERTEDTVRLADSILELVKTLPENTLETDQREQIVSRTLLLKGESLFNKGNVNEALEVFAELRRQFPDEEPAILSYLYEARYYSARFDSVQAQRILVTVADRYRENERYATIALLEAALNAEQRGQEKDLQEAITTLQTLVDRYPDSNLVYYALLKQADLARELGKFADAQTVIEFTLTRFATHAEIYRAEMMLGDVFRAQAGQNPGRLEDAVAIYERLSDRTTLPVDLRIEAATKWANGLTSLGRTARAMEVYYQFTTDRYLNNPERIDQLGPQGRYWLSKATFELAQMYELQEDYDQARILYARIRDTGLPGQAIAEDKLNILGEPKTSEQRAQL